jgi:hypothetical protein
VYSDSDSNEFFEVLCTFDRNEIHQVGYESRKMVSDCIVEVNEGSRRQCNSPPWFNTDEIRK